MSNSTSTVCDIIPCGTISLARQVVASFSLVGKSRIHHRRSTVCRFELAETAPTIYRLLCPGCLFIGFAIWALKRHRNYGQRLILWLTVTAGVDTLPYLMGTCGFRKVVRHGKLMFACH